MNDLNRLLLQTARVTSLFISLCLLAWLFSPSAKPFFAGLALGAAASFVNALFLYLRVKRIAAFAAGEGRRTGAGFWTRAAVALAAVIVAQRVPGIDVYGVAAGLFFAQLATLLLGIVNRRKPSGQGKG